MESKRSGALDFEVRIPKTMTVIYFKTFSIDTETVSMCQLVSAFTLGAPGVVSWHSQLESTYWCFCCLDLSQ